MRLRSRLAALTGCGAFAAAALIAPAAHGSWAAAPPDGRAAVTAASPESPASSSGSLGSFRLLGAQVIPPGLTFDGVGVGELSGLDYDRRQDRWYILSDDSEEGPARFYTADIALDAHGLGKVRLTGAQDIGRTDGSVFPSLATNDPEVADPESIRVDPRTGKLWWSSEGKREVPTDGSAASLVDPWVREMTPDGRFVCQVHQPRLFQMSAEEKGPRRNAVFEGLTFTTDGRQLVTSLEGPLYQDGPLPTPTSAAVSRLTWYDVRTGLPLHQVAYPIDPIPATPVPPTAGADNGISELLAVDRDHYLVLERSFVTGVGNSIRLYEIDVRGASDVRFDGSLADGGFRPVHKRLVFDFASLGLDHIDNIEGMSWGPRLPDGERSLVFVSDDNFNPTQVTQVIAVAVR